MEEAVKVKLQQIRLRKLECQRHIRILTQKLARNPRDLWTRKELEQAEELLAELEEQERRLLGVEVSGETTGGESDGSAEGEGLGSG